MTTQLLIASMNSEVMQPHAMHYYAKAGERQSVRMLPGELARLGALNVTRALTCKGCAAPGRK